MAMSGNGGHTVASMVAMGMTPEHAEVTVASSPHCGTVLYDKDHFVLYLFSADHGSTSTCYGACSSAHGGQPPLLTKGAPRVAGLNSGLLGTTKRTDGSLQVTYAGHPLYYWSGDTAHSISCQHVRLHGGFWYVVDPNGTADIAAIVSMPLAVFAVPFGLTTYQKPPCSFTCWQEIEWAVSPDQ